MLMRVINCEVNVFGGFLFELAYFLFLSCFSCTIEQRADRFEGFGPDAFFDFFAFKLKFEKTRATVESDVFCDA